MFDRLLTGETPYLIVLAALIAAYLWYLEYKKKHDSQAALCRSYAVLTPETLNALPDNELVRAVVANRLNLRPTRPEALSSWSGGQITVFTVWLVCRELEQNDFAAFFYSGTRRFAALAQDGFTVLGATETAAALAHAVQAAENGKSAPWDDLTAAFRRAVADEKPLERCVDYIRNAPAEFTDSPS